MSKVYSGITDILTSIISKVEPTAFEKILEKTTQKKISNQFVIISEHLERTKHPRGTQSNTCLCKVRGRGGKRN